MSTVQKGGHFVEVSTLLTLIVDVGIWKSYEYESHRIHMLTFFRLQVGKSVILVCKKAQKS